MSFSSIFLCLPHTWQHRMCPCIGLVVRIFLLILYSLQFEWFTMEWIERTRIFELLKPLNVNKKERERHLPGYCQQTSLESADRDETLQLMKATVLAESYYILSIFNVIRRLQRCLLTVARQVSLSFLLVNMFFYHFTFPGFPFISIFITIICENLPKYILCNLNNSTAFCNNHHSSQFWV